MALRPAAPWGSLPCGLPSLLSRANLGRDSRASVTGDVVLLVGAVLDHVIRGSRHHVVRTRKQPCGDPRAGQQGDLRCSAPRPSPGLPASTRLPAPSFLHGAIAEAGAGRARLAVGAMKVRRCSVALAPCVGCWAAHETWSAFFFVSQLRQMVVGVLGWRAS